MSLAQTHRLFQKAFHGFGSSFSTIFFLVANSFEVNRIEGKSLAVISSGDVEISSSRSLRISSRKLRRRSIDRFFLFCIGQHTVNTDRVSMKKSFLYCAHSLIGFHILAGTSIVPLILTAAHSSCITWLPDFTV